MMMKNFTLGALLTFVAIAMTVLLIYITPAFAGERMDDGVKKALQQRTGNFCNAVLPAWFRSKTGMYDQNVRALVADCYTGHARLAILGVDSIISLDDVAISELPAALLNSKFGMNLDVYRPLAGRTLNVQQVKK